MVVKKEYDLAVGDTLSLGADYSSDKETGAKYLYFTWSRKKVSSLDKTVEGMKSIFSSSSRIGFVAPDPGRFRLYLSVSDGANISLEDSVDVLVNYKPRIEISSRTQIQYTYRSVFRDRYHQPATFFVKVDNFFKPFPELHINRDPVDSIKQEEKLKKTFSYRMISLLFPSFTNFPRLSGLHFEREVKVIKPYTVDTLSTGYLIKIAQDKAFEDFQASYEVSISHHNLKSESLKIQYQNIVYNAISLYAAYETFAFGRFPENRNMRAVFTKKRIVRFGFAYNFSPEFSSLRGLYGTFSFGSWKYNMVDGIDVESPVETSLYFKFANFFPMIFGAYGRVINIRTSEIEVPKLAKTTDNYKLTAGGLIGFYLHPTKKLPLALMLSTGV
ncbi:hypothetical protein ASU31_00205 [Pedobacter ginsenosidimutans]|uniref:Uncharacterized protein n=1 Tax=Pedobacter ginsenosidimutans TaxID=687842 RepID=A0A0T5VV64_9SPHI|nr:hypothetical protein [Pedobacter ginsenosidimutans]KRT17755.1 hypothetical protein ASU31_00205 [Pedobacter ginsenosidimutans]